MVVGAFRRRDSTYLPHPGSCTSSPYLAGVCSFGVWSRGPQTVEKMVPFYGSAVDKWWSQTCT